MISLVASASAFVLTVLLIVIVVHDDTSVEIERIPSNASTKPPQSFPQPKKWTKEDLACLKPGSCGLRNSTQYCFSNAALQSLLAQRLLVQYFVPEALPTALRRDNAPKRAAEPTIVERELENVFRVVYLPRERAAMIETCRNIPLREALRTAGTEGTSIEYDPAAFRKALFVDTIARLGMGSGQHDTHDFRRYLFIELNKELHKFYGIPAVTLLDCTAGHDDVCQAPPVLRRSHCSAIRQHVDDPELVALVPPLELAKQRPQRKRRGAAAGKESTKPAVIQPTFEELENDTRLLHLTDMLNGNMSEECQEKRCSVCNRTHAIKKTVFVQADNQEILTINVARGRTLVVALPDGDVVADTVRMPVRVRVPPFLGVAYENVPPKRVNDNIETIDCKDVRRQFRTQFVTLRSESGSRSADAVYRLIAVTRHLGGSSESGHYIAATRNVIDGQWYEYNDSRVTPITLATDSDKQRLKKLNAYLHEEQVMSEVYSCVYERVS